MTIKTQRLLARANKIAKKGETEEAQKLYEMVLKDSPHNEEAKNGLLVLNQEKSEPPKAEIDSNITLYNNGQMQEALDSVETLIKSYPNEALLYNVRGACYADLGQLDTAVKSYDQALAIKPDYAEAYNNLGNAFKDRRPGSANIRGDGIDGRTSS